MDKYKERFSYRKNPFGCAVLGQAGNESVELAKLGNYGLRLKTIDSGLHLAAFAGGAISISLTKITPVFLVAEVSKFQNLAPIVWKKQDHFINQVF